MQAKQRLALTSGLYLPASQVEHVVSPAPAEKLPGAQGRHASWDGAPMTVLYVPASHCEHHHPKMEPGSSWYVPARHRLQLVFPVDSWKLPAGHWVHTLCPVRFPKRPAGHREHASGALAPSTPE